MKRILLLVLVFLMAFSACVYAESIDLSGMTDDELLALQDRIADELECRGSAELPKEVEVPKGVYAVGEDIPEGYWTITCKDAMSMLEWGTELDEYGANFRPGKRIDLATLMKGESLSWDLKAGTYVIIDVGVVVFTPYQKTDLGF